MLSAFLFPKVDLNEEKRVCNTQDDEIKSCCVQNQNKYIYRLSTAVNHMRFEQTAGGLVFGKALLGSVHPLHLLVPLLLSSPLTRQFFGRCFVFRVACAFPFPSSTSSQTPRFSHPFPLIPPATLQCPSHQKPSSYTRVFVLLSSFALSFFFFVVFVFVQLFRWRCLKLHPKAT